MENAQYIHQPEYNTEYEPGFESDISETDVSRPVPAQEPERGHRQNVEHEDESLGAATANSSPW